MSDQLGLNFDGAVNGAAVMGPGMARWGTDVVTPVERVGNVWLKRDDKFAIGGSRGGKVRTCLRLAVEAQARGATVLVTAGSRQSPQVNIVATIAATLGMDAECHVPDGEMTPELEAAESMGATLIRHRPGYNSVIVARAKESARRPGYAEIPFGMETPLAIECTRGQVANLPFGQMRRLVVPVGSGMTLAGVLAGLADVGWGSTPEVVGVVVGADPTARLDKYLQGWQWVARLIRSELDYHEHAPVTNLGGVELDPVYEAKCLPYLEEGDVLWVVGCRATVAPKTIELPADLGATAVVTDADIARNTYTLTDVANMQEEMWASRGPLPPTPTAVPAGDALEVVVADATGEEVVRARPIDLLEPLALDIDVRRQPVSLADDFVVPPFSVLDRRSGLWQDRKRRWLSDYDIKSEVGRGDKLTFQFADNDFGRQMAGRVGETSVFDPVLCELVYRWFSAPNARVLDPYCGGSVRGIVASVLGCRYTGVDIRQEQVDANKAQTGLCSGPPPWWLVGDATNLDGCLVGYQYDLVFSCPPYADLEVYSDDPRDISAWPYDEFLAGHAKSIRDACARLVDNRFAVWVIGDVRDKNGTYRGLHHAAVEAFTAAGLRVINECVLVDPAGTAPVRGRRPFEANRKVTLTHQHVLVFVKGDVRAAADWVNGV